MTNGPVFQARSPSVSNQFDYEAITEVVVDDQLTRGGYLPFRDGLNIKLSQTA
jgi:hypothetical protein